MTVCREGCFPLSDVLIGHVMNLAGGGNGYNGAGKLLARIYVKYAYVRGGSGGGGGGAKEGKNATRVQVKMLPFSI